MVTVTGLLETGLCSSALLICAVFVIGVPFGSPGLTRTCNVTLPLWPGWRVPRFHATVAPKALPPPGAPTNNVFWGSRS